MSSLPNLKQFWKQGIFLCAIAGFAAYYVKSNVTIRRKKQFIKDASDYDPLMQERVRSGTSSATIRPGFPIEDGTHHYTRKSEYEGAGNSYMSRRHGDKFGLWERWFPKKD